MHNFCLSAWGDDGGGGGELCVDNLEK